VNTMTERLESSLKLFGDREWPYYQVEHERHNRGGMYQHCGRADAETVGKHEKVGTMDEDRCYDCGGRQAGGRRCERVAREYKRA